MFSSHTAFVVTISASNLITIICVHMVINILIISSIVDSGIHPPQPTSATVHRLNKSKSRRMPVMHLIFGLLVNGHERDRLVLCIQSKDSGFQLPNGLNQKRISLLITLSLLLPTLINQKPIIGHNVLMVSLGSLPLLPPIHSVTPDDNPN